MGSYPIERYFCERIVIHSPLYPVGWRLVWALCDMLTIDFSLKIIDFDHIIENICEI